MAAPPLAAQSAARQPTTGPIARYDMRAGTVAGTPMGQRPSMASMLGGGGGGAQVQHELYLRLGSSQPAQGSPKADHFIPEGMAMGRSLALVTPREERHVEEGFPEGRRPQGRMLIFWGCGEHAGPGQPVVIDFSRLAQGQVPPGLWTSTILRDWGPTLENSKTFGRWPSEDGKYVKPDSALPGPHRVVANYAPPIAFTLAKDFMAPLSTRLTGLPSGAKILAWNAIPDATGYFATMFGGQMGPNGQMGDMVMWSSSASRQFGGGLGDWLSPAQVAGLVANRTVIAPASHSCAIPAEAIKAAGQFRTGSLAAFGPQEDFAYPPRPADPRATWNIQWTARIRHRSMTTWMDMPGMEGMGRYGQGGDDPRRQQDCRPRRGLGGIMGGMIGGGGGC
ncbi:MAG: hypothetical protein KGM17_07525 [Sphingomonadales bacterium]|nr:hypothetical protein [Sphingomonadales bacterium]